MIKKSVIKSFFALVCCLGLCLLAGYIGGYPALSAKPFGVSIDLHITGYLGGYPNLQPGPMTQWYAGIVKPIFSPPYWVFSPAWILSFILMGFTLFLIVQAGTNQPDVTFALILFIAQLLFMLTWAYSFFGTHAIFFAFLFMIALVATLLCAVIQIFRFSVTGGMLMFPYLVWVLYLAYLNYGIMTLNPISFGF